MDVQAKERWRMLTCAGAAQDINVVERIMRGFRPIAPKPVAGDPTSGNFQAVNKNLVVSNGRSKRKYVRVRKNRGYRRNKNNKTSSDPDGSCNKDGIDNKIVTLQLLPERADLQYSERREPWCNINADGTGIAIKKVKEKAVTENNTDLGFKEVGGLGLRDEKAEKSGGRVMKTWVTVERVMSSDDDQTCKDGRGRLGIEDVEIMMNLEKDKCPGFISDALNKVKWVNGAYRKMVTVREESEGEGEGEGERTRVEVLLAMKEKLPWVFSSLTCKVRVEYTWKDKYWKKMVMPCDVWRMECGGYAWRLDVEAALSLGR